MNDARRIEPRTLKGFRDYLPETMIPREWLIDTARRVYRSYGFSPIDTPALEYLEILTGKGSDETDKQLYKFQDHGERWVGMRFDLTVPLARFAAQHIGDLGTPFKRYHIATVWRGENTQRGRYREFMQCDFDTIGTQALAADIETALVIHDLFQALVNYRLHHPRQQPPGADRPARTVRPGRQIDRHPAGTRQAGQDRPRKSRRRNGRRRRRHARSRQMTFCGWPRSKAMSTRCSRNWKRWCAGNEVGEAGVAKLADLARRHHRSRCVSERLPRCPFDRPRARLLHRHGFRNLSRPPARHRQRLLRRPLRQLGRLVHQGRAAGHRRLARPRPTAGRAGRAATGAKGVARRRPFSFLSSTPSVCTTTCNWPPPSAEPASASSSIPSRKSSGHSSSTPTVAASRLAVIAGDDEWQAGTCQLKDLATGQSTTIPLADAPAEIAARLSATKS